MYPRGLWNSCEEPQKQHFIRGTIQNSDLQYMGEFKWEALCEEKAKEICLIPGPFLLSTILSWVTLMWTRWLKNKAAWLDLIPAENRLVGWVGGKGKQRGRMQFHKRHTHKKSHFSQCINLPRKGGEGRGQREGEEEIQSRVSERGVRKAARVDRSLEKAPHSPAGSCSALVLLVQCWWSGCPPPLHQNPPTPTSMCPSTALHVLELRWQPGPQTPAYGDQTKGPELWCAPQLGLCWSGQWGFMQPHVCYQLSHS